MTTTPSRRRLPFLLALPLLLGLLGAAAPATYTTHRHLDRDDGGVSARLDMVEMGGCQYLVARTGYDGAISIVHHAACTNPVHAATKPSTP